VGDPLTATKTSSASAGEVVSRLAGPPDAYVDEVALYVRRLALSGRGEDVRGRNLLALQVLEAGYANGWLSYAPNRDVARWLVMLLDLVGARRGVGPRARVERSLEEFFVEVESVGLREVAEVSSSMTLSRLARAFEWPVLAADVLGPRLAVASALWHLGFRPAAYRAQVHFEKNSQGKLVRRKITTALDSPWAQALRRHLQGRQATAVHILAALPPSFDVVVTQVQGALERVDEPLEAVPFAVFYSLVTDAARSGRRWEPPPRYVQGGAYTREDFERAVGRVAGGTRGRRFRGGRSVSLARLGLSSFFPETVAVIDDWLARCRCSELWVESPVGPHTGGDDGWLDVANARSGDIIELQEQLHAAVSRTLQVRT